MSEHTDHLEHQHTEELAPQSEPTTLRVGVHEELGVLLQQLKDTPAKDIRLVIPDRAVLAQGTIGLKLLAEEVEKLNKHVEIASESAQVQTLAQRAGLSLVAGAATAVVHGFQSGVDAAEIEPAGADEAPVFEPVASTSAINGSREKVTATASKMGGALGGALNLFRLNKWVVIGLVAVLLLGFGGLSLAATYLPQAVVTVYTQDKTLDRDLEVTADPTATQADAKSLTIPATMITTQASKTQSYDATGKKDIGDKAKGNVTLLNYTDKSKTLPTATGLISGKQSFTLDSTVTVPAATTQVKVDPTTFKLTNETTPGQASGSATAAVIGTDANIGPGQLTVSGYDPSSVSAHNDAAFSGGSKQTVTVVTADDQSQALDSLSQDVQDTALASLKQKVTSDQMLLDEAIKQKTVSTNYSAKVGDQVSQFSLTLTVSASAPVVASADLKTMLNTAVQGKVPDGYTLDKNNSQVENHVIKVDADGTVHLTSTLKTQILPQVDTEAMKAAIKGKKPQAVEEYLKSQPNLNGYDIKLTPKLPGPFYKLPSIDSHIQIQVQVKK